MLAFSSINITILTISDTICAIFAANIKILTIRTQVAGIVEQFIAKKTLITQYCVDVVVCEVVSAVMATHNRAG